MKYVREFTAQVGQKSEGIRGAEQIIKELNKFAFILDTDAINSDTGEMGGIGPENIRHHSINSDCIDPALGGTVIDAAFVDQTNDEFEQRAVNVLRYNAVGDGINNESSAFALAVSTINGSKKKLFIPNGTYLIGTNLTIPSNINLKMSEGAILKVAAGVTLTLNCRISVGPWKIFDVAATGVIGGSPVAHKFYPQWFGALGDGADATDATQRVTNILPNGGTLFFPSGTYPVGNDTAYLLFQNKNNIRITGEQGAILCNSSGGTGAAGTNILIETCNGIDIDHLLMKDTVLSRWSAYNNLLSISNCNNVHLHHNVFGESSNKHVHFQNHCKNILIEFNEWYKSHYNTNPATNTAFASLFFLFDGANTNIEHVTIRKNYWHDNYLTCIAANNIDYANYPNALRDFNIYDNSFENSGNGIIVRVKGGWAHHNELRNVGLSYMLNAYDFVTTGGLNRYYSKTRSANSGQAADTSNTITPVANAVMMFSNVADVEVENNRFYNCANANLLPAGQTSPEPSIFAGNNSKRIRVRDNIIDETGSTAGIKGLIWFFNNAYACDIKDNNIILPNGYSAAYVIKFLTPNDSVVSKNRVKIIDGTGAEIAYTGTIYAGISES
jgi:hypothetical protein